MAIDHLLHAPTWAPAVAALRSSAPEGTEVSEFSGTLSRRSFGGTVLRDGESGKGFFADEVREAFSDLIHTLDDADGTVAFRVRAHRDGTGQIRVAVPREGLNNDGSQAEIVLAPGARPEHFRRWPVRYDVGVSPAVDPERVRALVAAAMPDATPADPSGLAAAEAALKAPLPADLRALYEVADGGELTLAGPEEFEDGDYLNEDLLHGLRLMPLNDEWREQTTRRFSAWHFDATQALTWDPALRIQPIVGSPAWFVFATDGGGNPFLVDLAPGPGGTVGQVLYIERHGVGARWVASSVTELLTQRPTAIAPEGDISQLVIRLGRQDVSVVGPATEVLFTGAEPFALGALSAAELPRLRTLVVGAGGLTGDLHALSALPALEYIEAPQSTWEALLRADAVPDSLLAAGFTGSGSPQDQGPVLDALLTSRGLEPLGFVELTL